MTTLWPHDNLSWPYTYELNFRLIILCMMLYGSNDQLYDQFGMYITHLLTNNMTII